MNESNFQKLDFGKIYICYTEGAQQPSVQDLQKHVATVLPNYSVELLATSADCAGCLVARRVNLGVVLGYGVLVVPVGSASLGARTQALAHMLLDVESFRSEPVLYINESASGGFQFRTISTCSTVPNVEPSRSGSTFRDFWQNLRSSADDVVDECEKKKVADDVQTLWLESRKHTTSVPGIFSTIGFAVKEAAISLNKRKRNQAKERAYEELVENDCCCAGMAAPYGNFDDDDDVEIVDEKEELAMQIATLIRTYVLKYGPIDSEKIQNMLRGKMCLAPDKVSPVVVNKDCKIILQDHNEVELKVGGPLPTSIYILFLRHPEGILMKDISDYRQELLDIHTCVAPTYDADKVRKSINDITEVGNERIDQIICRIRKNVKAIVPVANLADVYNINGKRNQPYFIPVAQRKGYVDVKPCF